MENTPKVHVKSCCSNRYELPTELWLDILSRIPVRSLIRFRCVSKTWRALIDDPVFARSHLKHSKKASDESRLLVVQYTSRGRECVVKCSKTLNTLAFLALIQPNNSTLATFLMPNGHVETGQWAVASSSIDGLIMLMKWSPDDLLLWNPSIRKARKVPLCPEIMTQGMRPTNFGMGFDPLTEDYKHVLFVHSRKHNELNLQFIAVYSVGTNSWKTIEFREKRKDWDPFSCYTKAGEPVCVGGVLYSIHGGTSFDLRTNTYNFNVKYPLFADPRRRDAALTTADFGRSLALVRFMSNGNGYVFVLQGSKWIWTRRYKFPLGIPKYGCSRDQTPQVLYLKKNGEMLLHWGDAMTSSNLETHQEEKIKLQEGLGQFEFNVWRYEESLLLLN